MIQLFFVILLCSWHEQAWGDYYNHSGKLKYFDYNDVTHADCIPPGIQNYVNYSPINKTTKGLPCMVWNEALKHMKSVIGEGNNYFFFPHEEETHNYCRSVNLHAYRRRPDGNPAAGHVFVGHPDTINGPWCYVSIPASEAWAGQFKFKVQPMACLSACRGEPVTTTTTTTTAIPRSFFHYNLDLMENLSDSLFSSVDLGDEDNYFNPNIENHLKRGAAFQEKQEQTLYIANAILVLVFLLLLAQKIYKFWKKRREEQEEEGEDDGEEEGEDEDEEEEEVDQTEKTNVVDTSSNNNKSMAPVEGTQPNPTSTTKPDTFASTITPTTPLKSAPVNPTK